MRAYITSKEELKKTIEESFEELLEDRLPKLIRRATEKRVYTIKETCELLDVSRRHLLYLRQSGKLGYIKQGKKIYFRREDLLEFFDRNYIEAEGNK